MKWLIRVLMALVTIVAAALGAYLLIGAIGSDGSPAPEDGPGSVVMREPPDPIPADDERSLIRADRFARVLAKVRDDYGAAARFISLRLEPESLWLEAVGEGKTDFVRYDSDAEVVSRRPGKVGSRDTVPLARIEPAIPTRIMESARRKFGIRLAELDSMAVSTDPAGPYWVAFAKEGPDRALVSAPLSGRPVTRE